MKNVLQIKQCNRSILCAIRCSMNIVPLPVVVKLCSQLEKNQSHKYLSFRSHCLPLKLFMARLFQPKSSKKSIGMVYYREKVNVASP